MKKTKQFVLLLLMLPVFALIMACSTPKMTEQVQYDLGPMRAFPGIAHTLPAVIVAEVNAPAWLDSGRMIYRLTYANDQQMRSYAQSRWVMPPAKLFEQRLKARITQAGGVVLSAGDGATKLPLIKIDAEEFIQVFGSATESTAHVTMRVSLLRDRSLIAQKTFSKQSLASSADAAGGAKAIASACDALIDDVMAWLAGQSLK